MRWSQGDSTRGHFHHLRASKSLIASSQSDLKLFRLDSSELEGWTDSETREGRSCTGFTKTKPHLECTTVNRIHIIESVFRGLFKHLHDQ